MTSQTRFLLSLPNGTSDSNEFTVNGEGVSLNYYLRTPYDPNEIGSVLRK